MSDRDEQEAEQGAAKSLQGQAEGPESGDAGEPGPESGGEALSEEPQAGGEVPSEELPISAELLEILACPKCKGELELVRLELICHGCRLAYRIEDGIPIMLIDEARPL